ncbi:hypothetical protein PR003_g17621 [Phytophthora rubi]|uniref:Serine protease n=2 Tax=Phytophthora TaxID=4783 RepID=A0A6A3KE59_9STRA|nr:hypothetical protein PR001_g18590 [Phytophthora rubi]KAE9005611.1 hypothetical protein PR002_g16715 [Phytophthora rubi]KAE9320806.1 hypothetical protein PR003_g17621 [Phytophthora rubi]KAE9324559.1 hypothetical protein PF008_g17086 [Phytophthora fragariae]
MSCPPRRRHSVLVLACLLSCTVVEGGNEVDKSSLHRNLRPRPEESANSVHHESRELSIFGQDGRQKVSDPNAYPYSTVGLLSWNDDVTCTATLVATNIVLTAAECVLNSDGEVREDFHGSSTFSLPQATEIQTASVSRVHKQSDYWTKWTKNTYVLVELDDDLGTANGVLHLPKANSFAEDAAMSVQLVGYEGNTESECFQRCTIHFPSEFKGPAYMLHHDCDVSTKRSPGSPMLIRSTAFDTYIMGIHTNAIGDDQIDAGVATVYPSYNDTFASRGVLGSFVEPHLSFLLQQAELSSASSEASSVLEVSSSNGGISTSSSSNFVYSSASNGGNSQGHDNQADAGASAALAPPSAASSSAETSVAAPQLGIAATAAYSCIGLVCASWLAIIFVAARRLRSNR